MQASTVVSVTTATLITGFVGYAVYFDYKRRNDPAFRSQLKKDRKRTSKELKKQSEKKGKEAEMTIDKTIKDLNAPGALPTDVTEKEAVFMQSVQEGELLAAQGQDFYLAAASAFYKALKVYPEPLQLLVIYQKAVPEAVFKYIYEMHNKDSSMQNKSRSSNTLEDIDDVAPSQQSPTATVEGDSPPSAPVSSQGGDVSSVNTGDASSQEWEKVSQYEGDTKKAEEEVVSATDQDLAETAKEALEESAESTSESVDTATETVEEEASSSTATLA